MDKGTRARIGVVMEACHVIGRHHEAACAKPTSKAADELAHALGPLVEQDRHGRGFLEGLIRDLEVDVTIKVGPPLGAKSTTLSTYLDRTQLISHLPDGQVAEVTRREFLASWVVLTGGVWAGPHPSGTALAAVRQEMASGKHPATALRALSKSVLNYAYRLLDASYNEQPA